MENTSNLTPSQIQDPELKKAERKEERSEAEFKQVWEHELGDQPADQVRDVFANLEFKRKARAKRRWIQHSWRIVGIAATLGVIAGVLIVREGRPWSR